MRAINVHDLKNSLDQLCQCLDNLYSINCGGCCYVAYLIACHLDRLKVKYDLIIYDDSKKDVLDVSFSILNRELPNSVTGKKTCMHYCISISGSGVINEGSFFRWKKHTIKGITSKNLKWLYRNGAWNRTYNRKDSKCVKGIIDSFFLKYEKSNLSNH